MFFLKKHSLLGVPKLTSLSDIYFDILSKFNVLGQALPINMNHPGRSSKAALKSQSSYSLIISAFVLNTGMPIRPKT